MERQAPLLRQENLHAYGLPPLTRRAAPRSDRKVLSSRYLLRTVQEVWSGWVARRALMMNPRRGHAMCDVVLAVSGQFPFLLESPCSANWPRYLPVPDWPTVLLCRVEPLLTRHLRRVC